MVQAIAAALTAVVFTALVPAVLLPVKPEPETVTVVVEQAENAPGIQEKIQLKTEKGIIALDMEEYLVGVVLSEMPASFHIEALKAQAVAARTFAQRSLSESKHRDCDLCAQSDCCQAWTEASAMVRKLGNAWESYYNKARCAVWETEGEILTYKGAPIEAVYFSCSGGRTEDAAAVWGSEVPYLQSVKSDGEEDTKNYSSQVCVSVDAFRKKILAENECADLNGAPAHWIGETTYSQGGGVDEIIIGGQSFDGTRIRALFDLKSTQFTVLVQSDKIIFRVLGYGHRVGMSQYGANIMAEEGSDYKQILTHYYTGVQIERR